MKTLYFLNRGEILSEAQFVPIKPKSSDWYKEINPTRLLRSFEFDKYENLIFFVTTTLKYANKINHHPQITIEGDSSVLIETYTHTLNDISEQDIRLTRIISQIYLESTYSQAEDSEEKEEETNVNNDERLTERYHFDWTTDW